jgi:hypothetical protein
MRTKTLFLAAAALAASLASSMAQNVYSVNFVGYINTPITGAGKYTLVSNPFDNGTNDLVGLVDPSGTLPAKTQVLLWNNVGASYTTISKTTAGWGSNPTIAQGRGFFLKTASTQANYTNLYMGSCPVSNSVAVPTGLTLSGGLIPFAGDLTTDTNINIGSVLPNKAQFLIWNAAGQSYTTVSKTTAGWGAAANVVSGQGFFIRTTAAVTWTSKLPTN